MPLRLQEALRGWGLPVTVTVLCALTSVLFLLADLQSSDRILWTGQRVSGYEQNGLVFYRYHGQDLTQDIPNSNANHPHVDVYIDRSNPDNVQIDSTAVRVLDGAGVLGPWFVAAVVWATTLVAARRSRRRRAASGFGTGIPDELIGNIMRNQRRELDQRIGRVRDD